MLTRDRGQRNERGVGGRADRGHHGRDSRVTAGMMVSGRARRLRRTFGRASGGSAGRSEYAG
jgi:hypothetical protein